MAVDEEVRRLLLRMCWMAESNNLPGVDGTLQALVSTEAGQRRYGDPLDILGPNGSLEPGVLDAPHSGTFEAEFRVSVLETIRSGSSQVLREIIAERRLGLPRKRPSK